MFAFYRTSLAKQGQPALAPARLALITIMQFVEGLTDRQAADAVRSRIDWKCALGLELSDRGFDVTVHSSDGAMPMPRQGQHFHTNGSECAYSARN